MGLRKIFQGYNFMGNRIINAKTNTPTDGEHLVNKNYSDDSLKINAVIAENNTTPFMFDWVTNLHNKSIKTIITELFYPRVLPVYNEPSVIYNMCFSNVNTLINASCGSSKQVLFSGKQISTEFEFEIEKNNRETNTDPGKILIIYPDTSQAEFTYEGDSGDLTGKIEFDFIFTEDVQLYYIKNFQPSVILQDSYGDDYLAPGFDSAKNIIVNIMPTLIEKSNIFPSFMISSKRNDVGNFTINDFVDYDKTNEITMTSDNIGIYDLLIPKIILAQNLPIYAYKFSYDSNDKQLISHSILPYPWLRYYTSEISDITIDGITYVPGQFNFGLAKTNTKIILFIGDGLNLSFFE